jgi:DNA segregation ATPase FtsK/SpoIIIE-like protein
VRYGASAYRLKNSILRKKEKNMNWFTKRKPRQLKSTEENVLQLLASNGYLSTSMLQREFGIGYAKAARMIDRLAEKGCIKHDGQRWIANDGKHLKNRQNMI